MVSPVPGSRRSSRRAPAARRRRRCCPGITSVVSSSQIPASRIGDDRLEHRGQPGAAPPSVEGIVPSLEVDVRGIDDLARSSDRLRRGVAVRDEQVPEARRAGQPAAVERVLQEDRRLDVRVGDGAAPGATRVPRRPARATGAAAAGPGQGAEPWAISQFWQNVQWNGQPAWRSTTRVDPGRRGTGASSRSGRGRAATRRVGQARQGPLAVLAHAADPRAAGSHEASVRADPAADAPSGRGSARIVGTASAGKRSESGMSMPGVSRVPAGRSSAAGMRLGALPPCPRRPVRRTIRSSSEARVMARPDIIATPGSTADVEPVNDGGPLPIEIRPPSRRASSASPASRSPSRRVRSRARHWTRPSPGSRCRTAGPARSSR